MAVLLVLFQHLGLARGGRIGVDIFFVLSGFLITTILLGEQRATGRIHIGRFYARRALRLLPALALVVTCVVTYVAIWQPQQLAVTVADAGAIAVYLFNWRLVSQWPNLGLHQSMFSHVWSLSVEEQFYIFWPALLMLSARLRRSEILIPTMLLLGIAYPGIARAVLWKEENGLALDLYFRTDLRIDGMMCGALVAWLSHRGYRPGERQESLLGWLGMAALAGLLMIASVSFLKW